MIASLSEKLNFRILHDNETIEFTHIGGQVKLKANSENMDRLRRSLKFDKIAKEIAPYEVKVMLFSEIETQQFEPSLKNQIIESIQRSANLQNNSFAKIFSKMPPGTLKNNFQISDVFKTTFKPVSESYVDDPGNTFSLGSRKFLRKNKIEPKKCTAAVFTEFGVSNQLPFLSSGDLPSIFNVNHLYFLKRNSLWRALPAEQIIEVGFVDCQEDFLPGFNFFVSTEEKTYLFGVKLAYDAKAWVTHIEAASKQAKTLSDLKIESGFPYIDSLKEKMVLFDIENIFESCRADLTIPPVLLNKQINTSKLKLVFSELKRHLKFFKIQSVSKQSIQAFILKFHSELSRSLCGTRFDFDPSETLQVYRIFDKYFRLLFRNRIEDKNGRKLVLSLNNLLFDKLIRSILNKVRNSIDNFIVNPSTNIIGDTLKAIIDNSQAGPSNMRLSLRIVEQVFIFTTKELKKIIVQDSRMTLIHLANLLKLSSLFSSLFIEFINKNFETKFDEQLPRMLENTKISILFTQVSRFSYARMVAVLEDFILSYFSQSTFKFLDLKRFFDNECFSQFLGTKTLLNPMVFDLLANHLTKLLVQKYFDSLLTAVALSDHDLKLQTRIARDRALLNTLFKNIVKKENLTFFLMPFNQVEKILSEVTFDLTLNALLNFNVFYSNKLTTEIVSALLENNILLPLTVEQELTDFFNTCTSKSSKPFKQNSTAFRSFLPCVSFSLISEVPNWIFSARRNRFLEDRRESINLSDNGDLVNVSACETYLENLVKVMVTKEDSASYENYLSMIKAKSYEKYLCKVHLNRISFINIENSKTIWSSNIIFLSNISIVNDLILTFSISNKHFAIIFPTKIERNLWFYSIKNMKKECNHVHSDESEISAIKTDLFKLDYNFAQNGFVEFQTRIHPSDQSAFETYKMLDIPRLSEMIRERIPEGEKLSIRNPIDFGFFERLENEGIKEENHVENSISENLTFEDNLSLNEGESTDNVDYIELDPKCFTTANNDSSSRRQSISDGQIQILEPQLEEEERHIENICSPINSPPSELNDKILQALNDHD